MKDLTPGELMVYQVDRALEDRLAPTVKAILGNQFFTKSLWADEREGTDFLVLSSERIRVAVRLRRHGFREPFGQQFTIRWSRPSGVPTEIHKILAGLVDYFLYGFVDAQEQKITQYFIGDLKVFRLHEPQPVKMIVNPSLDSTFGVFDHSDMAPGFVIKVWPSDRA